MTKLKYRPEIDGLRAIAVMSVVLFHMEIPGFSGGFIGVDIFFVISGYLITRLIYQEHNEGYFQFRFFYLRRMRRLLPALYFTILLCFIFSSLLFSPHLMERFSGAQISAVLSVSNMYFWFERGYFDASATLKPLLHTWSLSVEEQFYFIWPALLILLISIQKKYLLHIIIIGCFLTFIVGELFLEKYPTGVFFLTPFRAFEFGIGALIVLINSKKLIQAWFYDGLGSEPNSFS